MGNAWTGKIIGLGIAAGLTLAAEAGAYDWCPSPSDYTLACWNCTATLTCDYNGMIRITGNNVTLDGNGRSMTYSPDIAIRVFGYGSTIKNLNIFSPGHTGILYTNTEGSSRVDNVLVFGGAYGILAENSQHLTISNSQFLQNRLQGVYTIKPVTMTYWTDISNSKMDYNGQWGLYSLRGYYQIHSGNSYTGNGQSGVYERYGQRNWYDKSTFNDNAKDGLFFSTDVGTVERLYITNSSGSGNGSYDCSAWPGTRMTVTNSSFAKNSGCVTTP